MTIPGSTSTGSKRPSAFFGGRNAPFLRMVRARGCLLWDQDGREYVDTAMALGAVALGYGHPAVVEAAQRAISDGGVGTLAPVLEGEVAERLVAVVPGAEAVRFLKTGAEAVAAAVRVARAATGRDRVITCGYHGWLDWCQFVPGVPQPVRALRREIPFNDSAAVEAALREFEPVAAVVVEPVVDGPAETEWLSHLREASARHGAVLVFDEIKTAFRIALGGIAEERGIVPDLSVIGKALGNGFPIAAVLGRRDLLETVERTWISSTLATEFVSLAAARAVLETFERENVIDHLTVVGRRFQSMLQALALQYPGVVTAVRGVPQMCYLSFVDDDVSGRVAREAAHRGLLFSRHAYNFVSLAHTDAIVPVVEERLSEAIEAARREC